MSKKNKFSKWTEEDIELLRSMEGSTLDEMKMCLPDKKREAIAYKCKTLKIDYAKLNKAWTAEEDELLVEISKGKTYKELKAVFPNRTPSAIEARCQYLGITDSLILDPNNWSNEEEQILINNYHTATFEDMASLLPKRTLTSIQAKARRLRINIRKYNKSIKNKQREERLARKGSLQDTFEKYKTSLKTGEKFDFTGDRMQLCYLFKYYLRTNSIEASRSAILNDFIFGKILEDALLKARVKKHFEGYYDFICHCFPSYKFKIWEFKNLAVPNKFWYVDDNCFRCIEHGIEALKSNSIISKDTEILYLSLNTLRKNFNETMVSLRTREIFFSYFDSKNISYDYSSLRRYDGETFDSMEELEVYKFIKNYTTIEKLSRRHAVYNHEHEEKYVPDFLVNGCTLVEYYGLWNATGMYADYTEKAKRKNNFYKSNGYSFIAIYPEDLSDGYSAIKNKLIESNII